MSQIELTELEKDIIDQSLGLGILHQLQARLNEIGYSLTWKEICEATDALREKLFG